MVPAGGRFERALGTFFALDVAANRDAFGCGPDSTCLPLNGWRSGSAILPQ